jgi:hypothetical protein
MVSKLPEEFVPDFPPVMNNYSGNDENIEENKFD